MLKKYFLQALVVLIAGMTLYATNPSYEQHENKVAKTCQTEQNGVAVCPLGFGSKSNSNFKRESFSVYSAGIISYSTYQEKLSSFGILGNVFLRLKVNNT